MAQEEGQASGGFDKIHIVAADESGKPGAGMEVPVRRYVVVDPRSDVARGLVSAADPRVLREWDSLAPGQQRVYRNTGGGSYAVRLYRPGSIFPILSKVRRAKESERGGSLSPEFPRRR